MDRQMSYKDDSETHKISLTRKVSYKTDPPVIEPPYILPCTETHLNLSACIEL